MKIFIEKSTNDNPYENLAYETALSDFVLRERFTGEDLYGLFLWQNNSSIIFGRNQNIRSECNYELAKEKGIKLVRRNSGGGAVYHDLGNLNFTFFGPDNDETKEKNNRIVIDTLAKLGIQAEISGRNDFTIAGKKFSGNAYTSRDGILVHHGTLMIDLDTDLATELLTPPESKLEKKGVKSVKGRIVNLGSIDSCIAVKSTVSAMVDVFKNTFLDAQVVKAQIDETVYQKEYEKLISPRWIDEDAISNGITVNGDFGFFKFSLVENEGKIEKICYESDILEIELIEYMIKQLQGVALDEDALADQLELITKDLPKAHSVSMINTIGCAIINSIK